MKAVLFNKTGAIENLKYEKVDDLPPIRSGEVKLRFRAGSLNHLDLWVLKGLPRVQYQYPHICGADICGEVVQSKSKKYKVGSLVLVYPAISESRLKADAKIPENLRNDFKIRGENITGVFCDFINVHEKYLMPAPKHLSPEEAASLPLVYLTAWQMLTQKAGLAPHVKFVEPIIVHGAGSGVSQALCELLYSFKIKNIGLSSRAPEKLERWSKRGFKAFTAGDNLEAEIKSWAGSQKVSVIFDHIGGTYFEMNIRLLKRNGKFISCGATSGFSGQLDLRHLYFRQLQLLGSTMGSLQNFRDSIQWIAKAKIRPQISEVFSLKDCQKAYLRLENAEQTGKIILTN